jgi:hypothetical protein
MSLELSSGLMLLLVTTIGALTALVEKIRRDLRENTQLTEQAKNLANGNLRNALERLASERNRTLALREIVREQEDRLAFIVSRHPEVESTLHDYRDRRTRRVTEAEESAAEHAALNDE